MYVRGVGQGGSGKEGGSGGGGALALCEGPVANSRERI